MRSIFAENPGFRETAVLAVILIAVLVSACPSPTDPGDPAVYRISEIIMTGDHVGAANGASVQLKYGGTNAGAVVNTGTNGTYTIPGVPVGSGYTIEVSLSGYIMGAIPSFNVTMANVPDRDLTLPRLPCRSLPSAPPNRENS
jgi:hypothetical protein